MPQQVEEKKSWWKNLLTNPTTAGALIGLVLGGPPGAAIGIVVGMGVKMAKPAYDQAKTAKQSTGRAVLAGAWGVAKGLAAPAAFVAGFAVGGPVGALIGVGIVTAVKKGVQSFKEAREGNKGIAMSLLSGAFGAAKGFVMGTLAPIAWVAKRMPIIGDMVKGPCDAVLSSYAEKSIPAAGRSESHTMANKRTGTVVTQKDRDSLLSPNSTPRQSLQTTENGRVLN
jgi:hypothetical protein